MFVHMIEATSDPNVGCASMLICYSLELSLNSIGTFLLGVPYDFSLVVLLSLVVHAQR